MKKGEDYPGVTVSFLCHDGNGEYFFAKRSVRCRDEHGCWDSGGGGVDFRDSVEDTLRKEIREEYGTEVIAYEFMGYSDIFREQAGKPTHWVGLDFLVQIDREKTHNAEPHKFDEVGWFRLDDLPTPLHSQFPAWLQKYHHKIVGTQ